jgi:hypothetical protein
VVQYVVMMGGPFFYHYGLGLVCGNYGGGPVFVNNGLCLVCGNMACI